jgi:hypothetical protein
VVKWDGQSGPASRQWTGKCDLLQCTVPASKSIQLLARSDIRHHGVKAFTLLGCYAALVGSWIPTFRESQQFPTSRSEYLTLEYRTERFVRNVRNQIQNYAARESRRTKALQNILLRIGPGRSQRQARELISGPNRGTRVNLLSFSREQFRVVTGLLIGHNTLWRHLHLMGLRDSPIYRKCRTEDKTSAHILCRCEALASIRHAHLGSFFLDPEDIKHKNLGAIWRFSKAAGLPWGMLGAQRAGSYKA